MRRQVGRVVAAVAVVGAMVSGCGAGPSQVGSAAIVGSEVIALDAVQDQIAVALSPEKAQAVAGRSQGAGGGYGPPQVAREVVTSAILGELIDRRAAEEGITISDAEVDAAMAMSGTAEEFDQASLYTPEVQREKIRDDLAAAALAARYVDRLGVTLEFTGFATEEEARAAAQVVVAGGAGADAVFADAPPQQRAQQIRAVENPALATSFAFGTPPGSVILLRPAQDGAPWTLIRILERSTDLPPAQQSAVDRFGQADLQLVGYRMLQPAAAELGIQVNPRYGVWDPIQLQVVAADQTAGTIVNPPAAG
ncbi:MAG: SurA N-terminal domain-containing protein [Pseudonocardia sp.]|nr:SurA N-terminal domain-containing protein [Pseudonocardia sp.]